MKKLLFLLLLFVPFWGFSQLGAGDFIDADTTKVKGESLIYPAPTMGEHYYKGARNPSDSLDVVNLRFLFQRLAELDSLGLLVSDMVSGSQTVNTGETQIYFPSQFDTGTVVVVPYVRRLSDNAVIDYVINDVDSMGFDIVVWENNIKVSYVASNRATNNFSMLAAYVNDSSYIKHAIRALLLDSALTVHWSDRPVLAPNDLVPHYLLEGGTNANEADTTTSIYINGDKVGIGTTTATAKLQIYNSNVLGSIKNYQSTSIYTDPALSSTDTDINTTVNLSGNPSAAQNYMAINTLCQTANSATTYFTGSQLRGASFVASHAGSSTITNVKGFFSEARNTGSGGAVSLIGVQSFVRNTGSGNMSTGAYNYDVLAPVNTGGGTIPLYIQYRAIDVSVGTDNISFYSAMSSAANKYFLYGSGTAKSYLGGNVGIKTTAPDVELDINCGTNGSFQLTYNDANGSATNKVNLSPTSTGMLYINPSGGKLGLNTNAPSATFHVSASGSTSNIAIFQNDKNTTLDSVVNITKLGGIEASGSIRTGTATNYLLMSAEAGGNGVINVAAGDTVKLGGATNYTGIEPDGTIVFRGNSTVWDDVNTGVAAAKLPAANFPAWTAFTANTNAYTFAVNDYADLSTIEIPHGYKEGSNLEVHCHIATNGTNNATARKVKYIVYYTYCVPDNGSYQFSAEASLKAELTIPANQLDKSGYYISIGTITGTGLKIGTQLKLRFKRIASTGTEPINDPFVGQVGIHFEKDMEGSRTISSK